MAIVAKTISPGTSGSWALALLLVATSVASSASTCFSDSSHRPLLSCLLRASTASAFVEPVVLSATPSCVTTRASLLSNRIDFGSASGCLHRATLRQKRSLAVWSKRKKNGDNDFDPSEASRLVDGLSAEDMDRWMKMNSPKGRLHRSFRPRRFARKHFAGPGSVKRMLLVLNTAAFAYQLFTAVRYLPAFNRVLLASVAGDAASAAAVSGGSGVPQLTAADVLRRVLTGGAGIVVASGGGRGRFRGPIAAHSMGPFFLDFAHQAYPLSRYQKHRYLTSGFLHGSLLHLYMNMRALASLPPWLESEIGKGVYLSAYLVAIVTGNIAHTLAALGDHTGRAASTMCIGASGGICGLYGLMFSSMLRMGNQNAALHVMKQMIGIIFFGFLIPNVSNAGHIGGFLGGSAVGYLFGPGYYSNDWIERKKGIGWEKIESGFREVMGRGVYLDKSMSIFPLRYLWTAVGVAVLVRPDLQAVPVAIWKGFTEPGSLAGVRASLRP